MGRGPENLHLLEGVGGIGERVEGDAGLGTTG